MILARDAPHRPGVFFPARHWLRRFPSSHCYLKYLGKKIRLNPYQIQTSATSKKWTNQNRLRKESWKHILQNRQGRHHVLHNSGLSSTGLITWDRGGPMKMVFCLMIGRFIKGHYTTNPILMTTVYFSVSSRWFSGQGVHITKVWFLYTQLDTCKTIWSQSTICCAQRWVFWGEVTYKTRWHDIPKSLLVAKWNNSIPNLEFPWNSRGPISRNQKATF